MEEIREIRHFHMFCGSGGGGKGFNSCHLQNYMLLSS